MGSFPLLGSLEMLRGHPVAPPELFRRVLSGVFLRASVEGYLKLRDQLG